MARGKAAHPDHGLLSAYYLHQIFARARAAGVVESKLAEHAVRAVMLHSAAPVPVDVNADPVASVLLFANELFDWDPERALGSAPSDVGRTFHQRQVDSSALDHQARALLVHLAMLPEGERAKKKSVVSGTVRQDGRKRWCFDYVLDRPERLETPAYHTWLLKAQRLGRLRGERGVWPPRLALHTRRDERLSPWESLGNVLDAVAPQVGSPLRGALEGWLGELRRLGTSNTAPFFETLILDPRTGFDPAVDLNVELCELDNAIDAFVRSGRV